MALYFYQAFSKDGKKTTGYFDAATVQAVRDHLTRQGMYPVSIDLAAQGQNIVWWRRIFSRTVSSKDLVLFTKQLAVLLHAGVPLLQALELLTEYFKGTFGSILVAVKDEIKSGTPFASALARYPKVFDTIYVQLVRAGEASGKLESVLENLTTFIERRQELRAKVRSALRQPMIQLGIAGLVVGILVTFVVPKLAEGFAKGKSDLPLPTRILLGISDAFKHYAIFIIIALVGAYFLFRYWRSTPSGARLYDTIKLRLPIVGYFARMNAIVQFSQTLGILIQSGVNLAQSLDIVVNIVNNRILSDALNQARDKIIKQGKIAQYLKQTNIFPPIAIYLINTGEESGQLDTMLLTVGSTYERELNEYADTLSARLGPILLISMGLVVGFIIYAIMGPILKLNEQFATF